MSYLEFLQSKIKVAEPKGFDGTGYELHPSTKPHQRDIIYWNLNLGASLIAADTGTGKTHMAIETCRIILKKFGGKALIVTELGVAETFINDNPEVGEGSRLGQKIEYHTTQSEAFKSECKIIVTNYERIRNGEFDFGAFTVVWLDEGNYIKNMASKTTEYLQKELSKVKYKFVATATPSPNEHLELVNYAHVLGIADRGWALTRFFQRNSTKAGELTVKDEYSLCATQVDGFWMWVRSWAVFIQLPSDLGYDDEGYNLPNLNIQWIEVKSSNHIEGKVSKDGQNTMFLRGAASLPDAAKIKRLSIDDRLNAAMEYVNAQPNEHWIIWHHLEDERKAIDKRFKEHQSFASVYGSQKWEVKEKNIVSFSLGETQILATKPEISGVGCNFQKHCHNNIVLGVNHSFDQLYQLIKRTHRYLQTNDVNVYIFYLQEENEIVDNLKRKWLEHEELRAMMRELVLKYGLNQQKFITEQIRKFKTNPMQYKGKKYELNVNDCTLHAETMEENSVDMILSSFPFGTHYEYTDSYNDFGHNMNNLEFKKQLSFLLPNLLRVLKPGRIAAIHLKNRIHYGSVTGTGFSTYHRFTHMVCDAMEEAGFYTIGMHYIPTDVVAENLQTYRLGWSEACKDMTKMGAGIPEEIWVFRKAPTSNDNAYADEPVFHLKNEYTRAKWQIDADGFWRDSGNRLLDIDELLQLDLKQLRKWWNKHNSTTVYNYEQHVTLLQELDKAGKLSASFTTLPLRSNTKYILNDMNRMHGLNAEQSRRRLANHICPMPFDEVDRMIEMYSNKGETIFDPFGGLGTTGVRAIAKGRKAILCELSDIYAKTANMYLSETEFKSELPTLFDMMEVEIIKN